MHRWIRLTFLAVTSFLITSGLSSADLVKSEIMAVIDPPDTPNSLKVLFFGHQENNHHSPTAVFNQLSPVFEADGISLIFTTSFADITAANLANYDALMMNGNVRSGFSTANEPLVTIIQEYVRNGGSLIGLHVASAAFRFDPRFAELLGGRFQSHTVGTFTPVTLASNNPLVQNLPLLNAFDETYILKDLNPDIEILQERVFNNVHHPWTWVRTEQKGRVFYTASGHVPASGQTGTFNSIIQEAFPDLVQRGTHWVTKRHFSSLATSGILASGKIVGYGSLRVPNGGSYWVSDTQGPALFAPDGDLVTLAGEAFHFEPTQNTAMIPSSDSLDSVVFSRTIQNGNGENFQGIWHTDQSQIMTPMLVEGQPLSNLEPNVIADSVNTEIGVGFVANGVGQLLSRAVLENKTTSLLQSALFLSDGGVVVKEGDSHSELLPGVTFSDLSHGLLSLNSNNHFACCLQTSDGEQALARWDGLQLTLPILTGQAATELVDVSWGNILQLKINSAGDIGAIIELEGAVTDDSNTALIRIPATGGTVSILLQEGQIVVGSDKIGDLTQANFIMNHEGACYLTNTLTGGLVTLENDSALLKVEGSAEVIIREGATLPAISSTAAMGSDLSAAALSLDLNGVLYFKANKIDTGAEQETLFRVEGATLFKVFSKGEQIERAAGLFYEILTIEDLQTSGDDDGYPSSSSLSEALAVNLITTTGHRLLIKAEGLNDLDQDGLPNLLEAGLGQSANNGKIDPDFFPRFDQLIEGEIYFTYLRPTIAGLPIPQPQSSPNLEDWDEITENPVFWADQSDVPTGFERIGFPVVQSVEKRFFRLTF